MITIGLWPLPSTSSQRQADGGRRSIRRAEQGCMLVGVWHLQGYNLSEWLDDDLSNDRSYKILDDEEAWHELAHNVSWRCSLEARTNRLTCIALRVLRTSRILENRIENFGPNGVIHVTMSRWSRRDRVVIMTPPRRAVARHHANSAAALIFIQSSAFST